MAQPIRQLRERGGVESLRPKPARRGSRGPVGRRRFASARMRARRSAPVSVGAVRLAPVARQLAGDRGLEQRAAPGVETLAGALQRGLALGDLGEQLVDPRHDPPLLSRWREWDLLSRKNRRSNRRKRRPGPFFRDVFLGEPEIVQEPISRGRVAGANCRETTTDFDNVLSLGSLAPLVRVLKSRRRRAQLFSKADHTTSEVWGLKSRTRFFLGRTVDQVGCRCTFLRAVISPAIISATSDSRAHVHPAGRSQSPRLVPLNSASGIMR